MNHKNVVRYLLVLIIPLAGISVLNAQEDDEEVFELSPFNIDESEDQGYLATTTLAGTRIKSNLGDVGAAISVLTKEFMEDLGANEAETLLPNALNMEIGGFQGNFSADLDEVGGQNNVRTNPQNAQRVRGLDAATLTRNYFLTDIPFDSYNTDRITINRGPNSLLFGIGTPGGVIDNSLMKASVADNFGEVGVRVGERGSWRLNFNVNQVLIEDRLAIRVAGLNESTEFKQKPAYEDDERYFVALEAVLREGDDGGWLGRTMLRANVESGKIESNRPNVVPPLSMLEGWFEAPDPSLDGKWGISIDPRYYDGTWTPKNTFDEEERAAYSFFNAPGATHIPFWVQISMVTADPGSAQFGGAISGTDVQAIMGGWGFGGSGTHRQDFQASSSIVDNWGESAVAKLYKVGTVPYSVFDNNNLLLSGNSNFVEQDFDAWNITLEQTLFDGKGGLEIAFDKQNYDTFNSLAYAGNGGGDRNYLHVDMNEILPSGSPNPNVGRPFLSTDEIRTKNWSENENEALRVTAFYELDLTDRDDFWGNILGRHVLTGFYSEQTLDRFGTRNLFVWDDHPTVDLQFLTGGRLGSWRRYINNTVYVGPSLLGSDIQSIDDVRLTEAINVAPINHGDQFTVQYYDRALALSTPEIDAPASIATFGAREVLTGGNISSQEIDSEVLSLQSFFFNGNLVGLYGWRDDTSSKFERIPQGDGVSWSFPNQVHDISTLVLGDEPALVASGESITKSLVGHLPMDWNPLSDHLGISAHWSQSENFQPTSARRNLFGETLSPPSGVTEEYGVTFTTPNQTFMVRLNWFETEASIRSLNTGASVFRQITSDGNRILEARRNDIPFRSIGNPGDPDYVQGAYDWMVTTYDDPRAIAGGAKDLDYQTYDEFFNALVLSVPEPTRSVTNWRIENDQWTSNPILGQTATTNAVAEGFEIDIVGNLTPNWRLSLNVGQQETVTSNSAPIYDQVIQETLDNLLDLGIYWLAQAPNLNLTGTPGDAEQRVPNADITFSQQYIQNAASPVAAARSKDGTVSQEQREWRGNLATNYAFSGDTWLKGFEIGGAVRYQSKAAVGYEQLDLDGDGIYLPKLDDPIYGPSETRGDIWLRYRRKLLDNKVDWTIQLNMRNVIGDTDPIPIWANPDRSFARFRNPPTRDVFLSNTFKF